MWRQNAAACQHTNTPNLSAVSRSLLLTPCLWCVCVCVSYCILLCCFPCGVLWASHECQLGHTGVQGAEAACPAVLSGTAVSCTRLHIDCSNKKRMHAGTHLCTSWSGCCGLLVCPSLMHTDTHNGCFPLPHVLLCHYPGSGWEALLVQPLLTCMYAFVCVCVCVSHPPLSGMFPCTGANTGVRTFRRPLTATARCVCVCVCVCVDGMGCPVVHDAIFEETCVVSSCCVEGNTLFS